jgi:hypothetical protein
MTMFIQLKDGKPVGHAVVEENFRMLFPSTSFSWPFAAEDIEPLGFGLWDFSNQPDLGTFEKAVEVAPVKDEYGRWRQTWAVEPMNEEEVAARTEQEWTRVRGERSRKLASTDWWVVASVESGVPMSDERAAYRQALRDVPQTQTDPFNIVWPETPAA